VVCGEEQEKEILSPRRQDAKKNQRRNFFFRILSPLLFLGVLARDIPAPIPLCCDLMGWGPPRLTGYNPASMLPDRP
jgi:hypothetical protein